MLADFVCIDSSLMLAYIGAETAYRFGRSERLSERLQQQAQTCRNCGHDLNMISLMMILAMHAAKLLACISSLIRQALRIDL